MRLSRRSLVGVGAAAIIAGGVLRPTAAYATPATVTYTVAYAGADFTSYITATSAASIGSNWPASSTGHQTGTSSSASVIQLATAEGSTDYTGHPLTIGGTTCLITSYNSSTQAATVSARAGYPANFGSTPASGTSYTIADVTVVVSIGQAAPYTAGYLPASTANGNLWVDAAGNWSITGITMDATHFLTVQGNTAWSPKFPLAFNFSGNPNQPVAIFSTAGNSTGYVAVNLPGSYKVVFNNLQIFTNSPYNGGTVADANGSAGVVPFIYNGCWLQAVSPYNNQPVNSQGVYNNCVILANAASNAIVMGYGSAYNNCLLYGYATSGLTTGASYVAGFGALLNECLFMGASALTNPGSYTGYGGATFTRCYGDLVGAGITQIAPANEIIYQNGQQYSDLRTVSTAGTIGNGGAPGVAADIYGVTRSTSACTPGPVEGGIAFPAIQALTFSVAYNGDIASLTNAPSAIDAFMGPDCTYFQSGLMCAGTAADSSHIVMDASTTGACVGHPVQWKSGNSCVILSFNAATHTATVGAIVTGSYSATFGGTPKSGDAYTLFPIAPVVLLGQSAPGVNKWSLAQCYGAIGSTGSNAGAVVFSSLTNAKCFWTLQGTGAFSKTAGALGSPDSQPVTCLYNDFDHASVISIGSAYAQIQNVQLWEGGTTGGDGFLYFAGVNSSGAPGITPFGTVKFSKCVLRGDNTSADANHQALVMGGQQAAHVLQFDTCLLLCTRWYQVLGATQQSDFIDCTVLNTNNLVVTAGAALASGGTALTVSSTTGIANNWTVGATNYSDFPLHPGIKAGTSAAVVDGTHLTLSQAAIGAIASGDKIYFGPENGMMWWYNGMAGTVTNTIICGGALPIAGTAAGASTMPAVTTSVTDMPITGTSGQGQTANLTGTGFTQADYSVLFNNAFMATSGSGNSPGIDARLASGASVIAGTGTYRGAGYTDIFGHARPNPPTPGAQEYAAAAPASGVAGFFHVAP
jgi:hypothetical protein